MAGFFNRMRKAGGDKPADSSPKTTERIGAADTPQPQTPSEAGPPVFHGDKAQPVDLIGIAPIVRRLAELVSHRNANTPLSIVLLGESGSGKSFAINQLLRDVQAYAHGASKLPNSPFFSRIVSARVDADPNTNPALSIATAIHEALHLERTDKISFAVWAENASYAAGDPQQTVSETSERLAELRRRQDAEKQSLQEIESRRARLAENVLFDAAGSKIDTFARTNRASIESRLQGFGFTGGDPVTNYKNLVRDYSENNGFFRRMRVFFHSLWGYRGQLRLIILAILFAVLGWAAGQLGNPQTNWLANIADQPNLAFIATWIKQNGEFFAIIKNAAFVAAAGALLINIFRALRFLSIIRRGSNLLASDITARRKDLDNLISGQNQRINEMGKEASSQAEKLAQIERRVDNPTQSAAHDKPASPFRSSAANNEQRAANYIQTIARSISESNAENAPQRLLVTLDGLEQLNTDARHSYLQAINGILKVDNVAVVFAMDASLMRTGTQQDGGSDNNLDQVKLGKLANIVYKMGDHGDQALGNLVKNLLDTSQRESEPLPNASNSVLDEPMRPGEEDLLAALANLAGRTPRQIKRFVNTYKLTRPDVALFAPLALTMAVHSGGTSDEIQELEKIIADATGEDSEVESPALSHRLMSAYKAASTAQLSPLTAGALREANAIATRFFPR